MSSPPKQTPTLLTYEEVGHGPSVLFIHGIYGTGLLLRPLASRLAPQYRVILPDMRGHGASRDIPGPMHAEAVALDLIPTLNAMGIDRVHVVGHSHGGATAQAFAHLFPDRVRSLTLVSTYTFQPLIWWERMSGLVIPAFVATLGTRLLAHSVRLIRSSGGGPRLSVDQASLLASQMRRNHARRMAVAFSAARSFNSRIWLGSIDVPTLVVTGATDHMVSPRQAELLEHGIRQSQRRTIAGAGHMLPLTHEDELARILTEWLGTVEAAQE